MARSQPAQPTTRRIRIRRIRVAGLLIVLTASAAALGYQWPESSRASASLFSAAPPTISSSSAAPPIPVSTTTPPISSSTTTTPVDLPGREHRRALGEPAGAIPGGATLGEHRGALGEPDGAVPDGTTVFDDEVRGVANLNADLLGALRRAAADAGDHGVELYVDSGWRSPAYQQQLLQDAVIEYGSLAEAERWVASPNTSPHVSGDAVDIARVDATAWLSRHGAAYGLCQIYRNEPWHYELRPEAINHGCPSMYTDPTHDPRMEQ